MAWQAELRGRNVEAYRDAVDSERKQGSGCGIHRVAEMAAKYRDERPGSYGPAQGKAGAIHNSACCNVGLRHGSDREIQRHPPSARGEIVGARLRSEKCLGA